MIRDLANLDDEFDILISSAESENFKALSKMKKSWESAENRFDRKGERIIAYYSDNNLVAVCGRNIDPYTENDKVGRIRHLYVLPGYRRKGIAKLLVEELIKDANAFFTTLRLRTKDEGASKFYLSLGFEKSDKDFETHVIRLN